MGAGDVTILGPYAMNATGNTAADTAITALTHTDAASDTTQIYVGANGLFFYVMNIEGA